MQAEESLRRLLADTQTAILATSSSRNEPEASYAPFVRDDEGRLYVYVSALARHTAHLRRAEPISVMLIQDEAQAETLFARGRITWRCDVEQVPRDSEAFNERMDAFRQRFGAIMETLSRMRDFELFRLHPRDGRLVLGFGTAYNVQGLSVRRHLSGGHRSDK